jgi:VanZ family protein|tara:strand:+ start:400 stop:807 length:408 start_codon:yes stop_codon:yes gene_type:complete
MRGDLNDTGIEREFQWRHSVVPLFWGLLILGLHVVPGKDLSKATWLWEMQLDKLLHLLMFMLLSSSVFIALGKSGSIRKYKWFALSALLIYGCCLEVAQGIWFEGRTTSFGDFLADGLGVGAGRLLFRWIYRCWN